MCHIDMPIKFRHIVHKSMARQMMVICFIVGVRSIPFAVGMRIGCIA